MATTLPPATYLSLLRCPCSTRASLSLVGEKVACGECGREFEVSEDGILELVDPAALDGVTAREWQGNLYRFDARQVQALMFIEQIVLGQMRIVDKVRLGRRLGRIDEPTQTGVLATVIAEMLAA